MKTRAPTVDHHGLVAFHDQCCPVNWHTGLPAVLDINEDVFQPSWEAQAFGYRMVCADTRLKRWALRVFFGVKVDRAGFAPNRGDSCARNSEGQQS